RRPQHQHARSQGADLQPAAGTKDRHMSELAVHEAELTSGTRIEPGSRYGFFTDTTLCIGCKACEVACKEWNLLPADNLGLRDTSYDNTGDLGAMTWRH